MAVNPTIVNPPPLFADKEVPTIYQEWFRQMWVSVHGDWKSFDPVANITVVGTPTYTGRLKVTGHMCKFQIEFSATTSVATVAGTSYFEFPVNTLTNLGKTGLVVMMNKTTNVAVGVGNIDYVNKRIYLPTQAASANTFTVYGEYEV